MPNNMVKIAIVDDSVILRSALKNALETAGFQVVLEAGSSQELFSLLEKSKAELILLDVFFPTENGLDILAKLKRINAKLKVLLVTGMRQETILAEAQRLGADGVLYKPFDTDDLLTAIERLK